MASIKSCIQRLVAPAVTWGIGNLIAFLIWTLKLGCDWPTPRLALFAFLANFAFLLTLWYQFPEDMRSHPS